MAEDKPLNFVPTEVYREVVSALGFRPPLTTAQIEIVIGHLVGKLGPAAVLAAYERLWGKMAAEDMKPPEARVDTAPSDRDYRPGDIVEVPTAQRGKGHDPVDHPTHYTSHPSGVECITITEHMGFNLGNALKYIWRADLKGGLEDLRKAAWYIQREISKQEQRNG